MRKIEIKLAVFSAKLGQKRGVLGCKCLNFKGKAVEMPIVPPLRAFDRWTAGVSLAKTRAERLW